MSGHTGSEHDYDKHHHEHDRTPGDSPETTPKHAFGTAASTVAAKTVSFVTAKLPNKASRIVATAAAGALVLGGAGSAYAVHQNDVSNHNKQVAAEAAATKLAADAKAASDRAAAEQAAAEQAAADKAAADKAAADKAAADKAAADAAAKKAADDAAAKAAADKAAAQRAAAAAAANRDAQRPQLPSRTPTTTSSPKPTSTPKPPVSYGSAYAIAQSMVPSGQFGCFANIIERESGWNVHASNPSSGAYGLGQALPGSKMASAGSDWQNNPATQIKWVLSYMNSRYGSPCGAWSFWQSHSWY
ncbi:MAG: hypothetical protein AUG49_07185 [Catenulispora sp. 13_1_20CM_3_70_7]|nr:MAG: hypothetical protein AUG49_07185 [Catenulispora sp. 13_1_20CM_3_70_7]